MQVFQSVGFSAVFTSLEESGKVLYRSITKATVETVNHKYDIFRSQFSISHHNNKF